MFVASCIGLIVAILSLPVVLALGGPLNGWVLGVFLWSVNWGLQIWTAKVAVGSSPTVAVGMSGVSFISRAWLTAIILFVIALKYDEAIGLTAAGVFLAAFTCDLAGRTMLFALRSSFSRTPRGEALARSGRRSAPLPRCCLLVLPAVAAAAEETSDEFDPSVEFALNKYIPIDLGPIDLSINKAVLYMLISARHLHRLRPVRGPQGASRSARAASRTWSRWPTSSPRPRSPGPRSTQSTFPRYFPYIATLFLFIAVNNLISFIPLPVSHESGTFPFGIPDLVAVRGDRQHQRHAGADAGDLHRLQLRGHPGPRRGGLRQDAGPGRARRRSSRSSRCSRSSRSCCGWSASRCGSSQTSSPATCSSSCAPASASCSATSPGVIAIPVGVFFYIFEWVLIAGLQAFIFAMLSGIYIGFAVESSH